MQLAVFGANGPTGRLVTRLALERGHTVVAFTRHPTGFTLVHERLTVVGGDVADAAAVEAAVRGADAVLSSLGVPYSRQPISVYSVGTTNILRAMDATGVARFIGVSSSATDPSAGPHGGFFFEKVLQPFTITVLGRTLYDDMRRMEDLVTASDVDWTIMRPSGLFDAEKISEYAIAETYLPGKFTARIDLADAIVTSSGSREFAGRIAAVTTTDGAPTLAQMMVREAFKRPPKHDQAGRTEGSLPEHPTAR
jgi:putative NADH-flavin reductase